jgi:excinuclease ABC subunit B
VLKDLETRMREAAADLDFEEAARLRDEVKRLRATELAVVDDPTAKYPSSGAASTSSPSPGKGGPRAQGPRQRSEGARGGVTTGGDELSRSKVHKPALDEMGIALYHESLPHRPGAKGAERDAPRKPTLDEMGPGPESKPYRPGPRSTSGRAGMRGGWKPRGR